MHFLAHSRTRVRRGRGRPPYFGIYVRVDRPGGVVKTFQFTLAHAMEWRRSSVRLEEAKLETLYAELRCLEAAAASIRAEQAQSERTLFAAASVMGAELAVLGDFKQWVKTECGRLQEASAGCQKRIAAQMETVVQRRRDLRLLERLHERKLAEWKQDLAHEIDEQAEELNLRKLTRRRD